MLFYCCIKDKTVSLWGQKNVLKTFALQNLHTTLMDHILILTRREKKTKDLNIFSRAERAITDAAKGMVFISGGQLCSPDLFEPVDTDKSEKCKPASCCPHLSFNVRGRGGPALWDGNLMHINTGLHLWGSEGKTPRPSYRGWKGCTWIKSEAAGAHVHARARTHAGPGRACMHTHWAARAQNPSYEGAGGYRSGSYRVGCFWAHTYGGCEAAAAAAERVGWSEVTHQDERENIDMKKQRRHSSGSLLTCIKSTIRKWMETISSNWG